MNDFRPSRVSPEASLAIDLLLLYTKIKKCQQMSTRSRKTTARSHGRRMLKNVEIRTWQNLTLKFLRGGVSTPQKVPIYPASKTWQGASDFSDTITRTREGRQLLHGVFGFFGYPKRDEELPNIPNPLKRGFSEFSEGLKKTRALARGETEAFLCSFHNFCTP